MGVLVFASPSAQVALPPILLARCTLIGATLWTMASLEWCILSTAAGLSVAAAIRQLHGA